VVEYDPVANIIPPILTEFREAVGKVILVPITILLDEIYWLSNKFCPAL